MLVKLQNKKIEILFLSQIIILFGSLVMPNSIFIIISPILFFVNIIAGSLFFSFNTLKAHGIAIILLLLFIASIFILASVDHKHKELFNTLKLFTLFIFQSYVAYRLILEVWKANVVSKKVIYGVISGYISLGLVGFFVCLTIEIYHPNSFQGLYGDFGPNNEMNDRLMYFSYVTLMTIGYGDITPFTALAQKASILIGLAGQFYLMIITAIVVGKYINQKHINSN